MHKIANVNKALEFIEVKGVKLVGIGAEGMSVVVFPCANIYAMLFIYMRLIAS